MKRELRDSLLDVLLTESELAIHVVDSEGNTVIYNEKAAEMDGLSPSQVIDRNVLEVFPSLNRDTSTLLQVLYSRKPMLNQHQTYTNLNGREISTVNTTLPIFGQGGGKLGAVEIARDISSLQSMSEQILLLRQRLQNNIPVDRLPRRFCFAEIIGSDPELLKVLRRAKMAAQTVSPVLVTGETGVGKEMLVQSMHNAGPRAGQPLVAQNCAALPETLLEGLLFGSVRGTFTGAQNRPGLFELAQGGTLLLDEIGAMPYTLQAKLLRVLERGEVRRLGDTRERLIDVRVVAVTGPNPRDCLRPDLYYRLNVVNLHLPPLRQRRGDIPLLCKHFLARHNRKLGTAVTGISPEAMQAMLSYYWPGNVRELANMLEGIMNTRSQGKIERSDLPSHMLPRRFSLPLRRELAQLEQRRIQEAMRAAGNNITRAAALVDLPRQTLQRKLQRYGWHNNCNRESKPEGGVSK